MTMDQNLAAPPREIGVITMEIRALHRQAQQLILGYAIEIGRRLAEAKAQLPHGRWGDWLKNEVEFSQSTAQNFMRIFEEYGSAQLGLFGPEANSQTLGNLPYSKALALLAIPAEEREAFVEAHHVEDLSTRELQQAIRERDEARKRAAALEESIDEQQKTYDVDMADVRGRLDETEAQLAALKNTEKTAREKLSEAERELEALTAENEELKNRPVEVAVQVDEKAVEKARSDGVKQGRKEAEDAAGKRIAEAAAARERLEKELAAAAEARRAAETQATALQKQLEAAGKRDKLAGDADLVEFNVHFRNAQSELEKLGAILRRLDEGGQEELTGKLRRAMAAIRDAAAKLAGAV